MQEWVKLTTRSDDKIVRVNLAQVTHILSETWGSRICWSYAASDDDSAFLDVNEGGDVIMRLREETNANRT